MMPKYSTMYTPPGHGKGTRVLGIPTPPPVGFGLWVGGWTEEWMDVLIGVCMD